MRSQVTHLAGSRRAIRLLRFRPWREHGQRQGQHRNRLAVDHAGVVLSVQEFPQPGLSPRSLAAHAAYHGRLLARARRIVVDPDLAEDVVQEAFLGAWRNAARYAGARGSVKTWLLSIVHHRAIDAVRRRRPTAELPETDGATPAPLVLPDTWTEISASLDRESVRAALATLSEVQRQAIELAYFGGLTQAEIAERTGAALGTVKGRMRLGLDGLRAAMLAMGVDRG